MCRHNDVNTINLKIAVSINTLKHLEKISRISHIELQTLLTEVVTQFADENKKMVDLLKDGYQKMGKENKNLTENFSYIDGELLKYLCKDEPSDEHCREGKLSNR